MDSLPLPTSGIPFIAALDEFLLAQTQAVQFACFFVFYNALFIALRVRRADTNWASLVHVLLTGSYYLHILCTCPDFASFDNARWAAPSTVWRCCAMAANTLAYFVCDTIFDPKRMQYIGHHLVALIKYVSCVWVTHYGIAYGIHMTGILEIGNFFFHARSLGLLGQGALKENTAGFSILWYTGARWLWLVFVLPLHLKDLPRLVKGENWAHAAQWVILTLGAFFLLLDNIARVRSFSKKKGKTRTRYFIYGVFGIVLAFTALQTAAAAQPSAMVEARAAIDDASAPDVVMFSKSYCPFCKRAKAALNAANIEFRAIELDSHPDGAALQAAAAELSGVGHRTVPNIFIKGKHLGGASELMDALKVGSIHEQLQRPRAGGSDL